MKSDEEKLLGICFFQPAGILRVVSELTETGEVARFTEVDEIGSQLARNQNGIDSCPIGQSPRAKWYWPIEEIAAVPDTHSPPPTPGIGIVAEPFL